MPRKKTFEEVKQAFDNRGYILVSKEYVDAHSKLQYICPKHPDIIQEISYNKLQNGQGCPICARKKKHTIEEARQRFAECGYELLEEKYINASTKMRYRCPVHPEKELYLRLSDLLNGVRCPYCSGVGRKSLEEIRQDFLAKGYILLNKEFISVRKTKLQYICTKHPDVVQEITYANFYGNEGCRFCKNTKGEKRIEDFLKENNILYIYQKSFEDLKDKRKLFYDFYLPEYNLLIEYQGEYHDGTVHKLNSKRQTSKDLEEQQHRDKLKKQYALDHNINFLEIWYWDFKNIEEILRKELGLVEFSVSGPSLDSMAV